THPRDGLLRHNLAAPDIDAVCFKRAIRLFDRTYNRDMGARFKLALIACLISEDTGFRRHDDFLLSVLVFNNYHAPIDTGHCLIDSAVRHRAVRPRIPWPVPFAQPTLRLRQDRHLNRPLAPVRLRSSADTDIRTRLDVSDRRRGDTEYRSVRGEIDFHLTELFRFDRQHTTIEVLDGARNAYRGRFLRK